MADEQLIKPRELPAATAVFADDAIMTDDGVTVGKATPVQIINAGAPVPTEAEAIAGTDNSKRMTPLAVKQVLDSVTAPSVLRAQAWAESDSPPNPGIPGSMSAKSWSDEAKKYRDEVANSSPFAVRDANDFLTRQSLNEGVRYWSKDGFAWDTSSSGGIFTQSISGVTYNPVPIAGAVDPVSIGALCDGVSDDTPFVQSLWDNGFDVSVSSDVIKLNSLKFRPFRSIRTSVGSTIVSTFSPFNHGNVGWREQDLLSYSNCHDGIPGSNFVHLSTTSEYSNFSVGDYVFMRGTDYFISSNGGVDYKIYDWGMINRVVSSSSSGVVTLAYAIDEQVPGMMISNISTSSVTHITSGDNLFVSEGNIISGFNINVPGVLFAEGGGLLSTTFDFIDVDADSYAFSNTWHACKIRCRNLKFKRHFFELALSSSYNEISSQTATLTTNPVSGKRPVRLSEGTRGNTVNCDILDISLHSNGDPPLYLTEGRNNNINLGTLLAQNAYPRIFNFGSQALTPTAPRGQDNTLMVKKALIGSSSTVGLWVVSGGQNKRNKILNSSFYGEISGSRAVEMNGDDPSIVNCRFESGSLFVNPSAVRADVTNSYFDGDIDQSALAAISASPAVNGVISDSWVSVASQNRNIQALTVSSSSATNTVSTQSFPAGSLRVGDIIDYSLSGTATGTSGSKNAEIWIGGAKIAEVSYLAAETGSFILRGTVRVQATTAIRYQFEKLAQLSSALVGTQTVSDISSTPLNVEIRAYRADGNTLVINGFTSSSKRAGR